MNQYRYFYNSVKDKLTYKICRVTRQINELSEFLSQAKFNFNDSDDQFDSHYQDQISTLNSLCDDLHHLYEEQVRLWMVN